MLSRGRLKGLVLRFKDLQFEPQVLDTVSFCLIRRVSPWRVEVCEAERAVGAELGYRFVDVFACIARRAAGEVWRADSAETAGVFAILEHFLPLLEQGLLLLCAVALSELLSRAYLLSLSQRGSMVSEKQVSVLLDKSSDKLRVRLRGIFEHRDTVEPALCSLRYALSQVAHGALETLDVSP